jgi:hypothetical protein
MSEIKIIIEGEGLSLTKYTTLQKAGQIISFLGVEQVQNVNLGSKPALSPLLAGVQLQPRDVITNSKAKTYPQKITAVAKYMRDQLGQNTFSSLDVKNLFKKLGDEPRNFSRDLKDTLDLQYIVCIDASADQYELTDRGLDAVENYFSEKTVKKTSGSKKTSSIKGIRDEVKSLSISGSLADYPDYHDLPTKADKILWLMQYVDIKGVKGVTPAEVDFLSTELRDRIKANDFAAHNGRNIRKSFITKTSDGFLIQKKGSDHLMGFMLNRTEEK